MNGVIKTTTTTVVLAGFAPYISTQTECRAKRHTSLNGRPANGKADISTYRAKTSSSFLQHPVKLKSFTTTSLLKTTAKDKQRKIRRLIAKQSTRFLTKKAPMN